MSKNNHSLKESQAGNPLLLNAALDYLKTGYSVLPIGREKRPALSQWKPFQENPPSEGDVLKWFRNSDVTGVGLVCGAVSFGLFIVDFDLEAASIFPKWKERIGLPGLTVVKTFKGYHVYFRCAYPPGNEKWARDEKGGTLIECKGEGGYCLAPPSLHPKGVTYTVLDGNVFEPNDFDVSGFTVDRIKNISATFDRSLSVTPAHAPILLKPRRPTGKMSRWEWALFNLSRLSPSRADDVKDWLRVGYALSEFGEDGFVVWNEWSKQSHKYPGEIEMRRRWKYLNPERKTP